MLYKSEDCKQYFSRKQYFSTNRFVDIYLHVFKVSFVVKISIYERKM